jgi:F-type H+-transporting ATPase subunit delta
MDDARLAAGRYAGALAAAVADTEELEEILRDLRTVAQLDAESDELHRSFRSPVIGSEDKVRVLREIGSRLDADPRLVRMLETMARNDRLALLQEVTAAVSARLDQRRGVHEVRLTSARPLGDEERSRLQESLQSIVGGQIRLSEEVDETLLGGIVARVGAVVFDGSLKTKLSRLRSRITGRIEGQAAV